jgi:Xaa-Pro aminopeptidase
LKYVAKIGSQAHLAAMKSTKAGLLQNQISAVFQFEHTIQCGCDIQAFPPINASGRDCATLHYIDN